ncbi:MAG: MATE family efflux transporter [Firmicutes bacterium CAG:176_59_8]|nr:MAG: MATE family efflux transporter [Firmicutes bacterium CAG:176_59_8]
MSKQPIRLSDHFSYSKLLRFTLPSICMMVFTSIYGVVDGLFVSNFAGKTPFAAINLVMPFIMILGGMGFMIGTGGTALVSKLMGEGKKDEANSTFSMMVLFTLLLGIVLSAVGFLTMRPVSYFLGATDAMIDDCVLYGRIVTGFTFAFMLQNVFQSFFIAAEKPRLGLIVTVAAGITNMVLDALFIAVFNWGVAGAAIATGLSQCVGGVLPLIYFLRPNDSLLRMRPTSLRLRPILQACGNGSSELMSNISSSLVGMLYNFQLMHLIGEDGVSAYGVLMYVQFIFVAIFIGYSIGCAPVVSFHFGAQNHNELKSLLRKSTLLMASGGVLLTIAARLLAAPLARLFVGYDAGLFELTSHAFRLFSWSFLLAGFNIFVSGFFTALNNGAISAAISFLRTLVFQTASVLILPLLLGVDGIWWAITVAEIFALLISLMFLYLKRNKYHYL